MTPIPNELRELMERIVAGDVGRMIYAKLATGQATETDDGKAWLELRALLATPPADAADMGGQAGEEVEVVQYQCREIGETDWEECGIEGFNYCNRSPLHDTRTLMTVAQHLRILAQHRQQAGKLVEALRLWLADYDEVAANPDFEPFPHVAERVAKTREALADWEKTK